MTYRNSDTLFKKEEDIYKQILAAHVKRYPRLEIQDLYKLVYQGAMGSEHAVSDPARHAPVAFPHLRTVHSHTASSVNAQGDQGSIAVI